MKNIFVGDIVEYKCNDGHFAYGENSDKLATECLGDGSYTLQTKNLAECPKIC